MDLDNAKTWIGSLILLIIIASIGAIIIVELIPSMKSSTIVNNQTLTGLTAGTPYQLVSGTNDFPADLSVTFLTNNTEGSHYSQNSTQWFVNSTYGQITILSTIIADNPIGAAGVETVANTNFNVTYTYSSENIQTSILTNGTLTLRNVTKQIPTLGIIMGVLLIISAVVAMTVYFGRKTGYA